MSSYNELYQAAKKEGALKSLTPEYKSWEKTGDMIIGAFVSAADVQSSAGPGTYKQYLFDTDVGLVKFALGKATDNEASAILEKGIIYVVTFKGKEKISGGRTINNFTIEEVGPAEGVAINPRAGGEDGTEEHAE